MPLILGFVVFAHASSQVFPGKLVPVALLTLLWDSVRAGSADQQGGEVG